MRRLRASAGRARVDPLYRASLALLANTGILTVTGFGYWTIAAHLYPPADIGDLSAAIAGASLLSALATFGLPSLLLQRVSGALERRQLVAAAIVVITSLGGLITVIIIVAIGPLLPARLHVAATGLQIPLIVAFVVCSSVSTATDAGLIALRRTTAVLVTNLAGGVFKVALLWPFGPLGYHGLMLAYVGGAALQACGSLAMLLRAVGPPPVPSRRLTSILREHLRFSAWTYIGTLFGIMPSTVVPIFVVAYLGSREGAWLTAAFLFAGTVNFIPANTAQALYAELRIGHEPPRRLILRALRGIYALVAPYVLFLVAAASVLLEILGPRYARHAEGALRVVALGGLFTGGTYIIDTVVIALGHVRAYVVTNITNAVLVVGGVVVGATHGVLGAGLGWTAGQGVALLIGIAVALAAIPRSSWTARPPIGAARGPDGGVPADPAPPMPLL